MEQLNMDARYYQLVTASIKKDTTGAYRVRYRLKNSKEEVIKESSKRGFETLREAKAFVERLKQEHAKAMYKEDHPTLNMTFSELYERYRVSRISDKPSTVIDRESIIRCRILPFFKDMTRTKSYRTIKAHRRYMTSSKTGALSGCTGICKA